MNYATACLGEITKNLDRRRKPLNERQRVALSGDRRYPYIGANNIVGYIDDYLFDEKILCVAEDGGYWGAGETCAFIYEGKCWVNNHAHVLAESGHAMLEYLHYYLNHADLTKWVTGTTRGKLTKSALDQITIPLPSMDEQEKLVALFREAEALVNKRNEVIALQDKLRQAYFLHSFGDLVLNPKKYEVVSLQEICDVRDGTHDSPKYVSDGFPLITSKNLSGGEIDFQDAKLISACAFDEINKRSKVDPGDILLPMIGTIGHPVIVQTDVPFAIKNVALFKFSGTERLTNRYLKGLLESHYFSYWAERVHRGGTQRFIALGDIRMLPIPLPPMAEQQAYGLVEEQIERQKRDMRMQLQTLEENFQSILHQAFQRFL